LSHINAVLFGDARRLALEHRLFNTITLVSAVSNVFGSFSALTQKNYIFLLLLNLGTGILFLVFYLVSRFQNRYQHLYWPFILLIVGFLFVNSLQNAGSIGGAHYYLIAALVAAIILSGRTRRTLLAILLFGTAAVALLIVEQTHPEWVVTYSTQRERLVDVAGNLLFVQIFTAILVQALTQNLNQERKKSDQLLLNVLPESIARELKQTEHVQPVDYESASVLFTDFVGFTQIAEGFTPQRLIEELDSCFSHFDRIARSHKLEKIKTIGDAYMAVGGIPETNKTHAVDCVLTALEITDLVARLRERVISENKPYWQIRVGIHSGDLIAGVIGRAKFSYDVWGDTVNTANRLESSGVAGRINISGTTYELVRDFFECEFRGKVPAKNKGLIEMYFVNRIRPELSADVAGRIPNATFNKLYRDLDESGPNQPEAAAPRGSFEASTSAFSMTGA
jgi:adenylate cyclase